MRKTLAMLALAFAVTPLLGVAAASAEITPVTYPACLEGDLVNRCFNLPVPTDDKGICVQYYISQCFFASP